MGSIAHFVMTSVMKRVSCCLRKVPAERLRQLMWPSCRCGGMVSCRHDPAAPSDGRRSRSGGRLRLVAARGDGIEWPIW